MRIGAFELEEPLPELRAPHAFAVLQPWIDVGAVGSSALNTVEKQFGAQPLGSLTRPGSFFDFTRYRPVLQFVEGVRTLTLPNTVINCARRPEGHDLVFFHLLEPHTLGELYVDSVLQVLKRLGVQRYCMVGGMYDSVPHTKPLIVSGFAYGMAEDELARVGVQPSDYEGPATIITQIGQEAPSYGMEAMVLVAHLPQYTELEEDYAGRLRLLEVLCSMYGFSIDLAELKQKAEEQYAELSLAVEADLQMKKLVHQLEAYYETRGSKADEEAPNLSPDIQTFLHDIDKRFGRN